MTTRSVASAAFDRFVFESVAVQDGVTIERGVDAAGSGLIATSAVIDVDTNSWLALQSRAGDDLLELGDDSDGGVDDVEEHLGAAFTHTFAVDTDEVHVMRAVLTPQARTQLMELERAHGPLVIVIDPGERLDDTTSLIVARPLTDSMSNDARDDVDVATALTLAAGVAAALS